MNESSGTDPVFAGQNVRSGMRYGGIPYPQNRQLRRDIPNRSNGSLYRNRADGAGRTGAVNAAPVTGVNGALPSAAHGSGRQEIRQTDLFSLISGLGLDEEKVIIIFLLAILAKNGADMPLLAALAYLLI